MSIELVKSAPAPQPAIVTTSWSLDVYGNGRKRFKVYAVHIPVTPLESRDAELAVSHPRMAGAATVIGEVTIEVPNLEVARILHAAIGQMLAAQPPEILRGIS